MFLVSVDSCCEKRVVISNRQRHTHKNKKYYSHFEYNGFPANAKSANSVSSNKGSKSISAKSSLFFKSKTLSSGNLVPIPVIEYSPQFEITSQRSDFSGGKSAILSNELYDIFSSYSM